MRKEEQMISNEFNIGDTVVSIGYFAPYVVEVVVQDYIRLCSLDGHNKRLTLRKQYMAKQWVVVNGSCDEREN